MATYIKYLEAFTLVDCNKHPKSCFLGILVQSDLSMIASDNNNYVDFPIIKSV